ncbi:MAG: histidine phosphatase family protein [Patescibacteria group bacterium]
MILPVPSKPITIHFVRHAASESNMRHGYFGEHDPPLVDSGREQAAHLGSALVRLGVKPAIWASSELVRAKETLEILAIAMHVRHADSIVDPRLNEIHRGDWTGKAYDEVLSDPEAFRQFRDDHTFRPPNGESMADVSLRMSETFCDLVKLLSVNRGSEALIVSHGRAIQALHMWFSGCRPDLGWRYRLDNTSVTTFEYHERDGWRVARINARPHMGW